MRDSRTVVKAYGNSERPFGTLYSDGVYETVRDTQRHFYRKFQGYGVSLWILNDLKEQGCVYVRIEERGAYARIRFFKSPLDKWLGFAAVATNNGGDDQKILPVREMVQD